jgi:hypothetical protein
MELEQKLRLFKSGLWLCWIAILLTPVGLLAIGGGPCAGPNNTLGSIILFGVGLSALFGALFGVAMVLRGIAAADGPSRLWGALSVCGAGLAGLAGVFYLLVGFAAASVFLRN